MHCTTKFVWVDRAQFADCMLSAAVGVLPRGRSHRLTHIFGIMIGLRPAVRIGRESDAFITI